MSIQTQSNHNMTIVRSEPYSVKINDAESFVVNFQALTESACDSNHSILVNLSTNSISSLSTKTLSYERGYKAKPCSFTVSNSDVRRMGVGTHTLTVRIPNNDGLTIVAGSVFTVSVTITASNTLPTISGSNSNLGDKASAFSVNYSVNDTDTGDTITVTEKLNSTTLRNFIANRNQTNTIAITNEMLSNLAINSSNTITIIASDGKGGSATRTHTFRRVNTLPTVSGTDTDLGGKNLGFNVEYSVNDSDTTNTLTVTERLNSTVLRTINNATRNEPYTISITDEQIKALELNSSNRVQIEVSDGQGGVAYRNYTFTKSNSAPVITGQDEDLGGLVNHFSKTYQVHDQEGDVITVTEKLNGTVLREFEATQNTDYTVTINEELWQTLGNETHVLTVEATDSIGSTSVRTFTFRRLVNSILLELKEPFKTDAKASKIMVVPVWRGINNADVVVSACNNALDVAPTWEDITDAVLNNIPYMFTNAVKTDEKWGVNIKFEITRKEGTTEQIILDGFGGAFE